MPELFKLNKTIITLGEEYQSIDGTIAVLNKMLTNNLDDGIYYLRSSSDVYSLIDYGSSIGDIAYVLSNDGGFAIYNVHGIDEITKFNDTMQMGRIADLTTSAKYNLVDAINELKKENNYLKLNVENLSGIVYGTVAANAEETYKAVETMTTPASVTISETSYPVIDNTYMQLKEVDGNTVVKNQILKVADYQSELISNNVKITPNNDGSIVVVVSGVVSATVVYNVKTNLQTKVTKYFLKGCPSGGSTTTFKLSHYSNVSPQDDLGNGAIFDGTVYNNVENKICIVIYTGCPAGTYTFKPQLINLTQMFGSGNEPTLVTDSRLPQEYIEYNEGELVSSNFSGVNSKDSDSNALGDLTFAEQTLKGVGTAQDKLVITKNDNNEYYTMKKINNIGSIDLGTLTWGGAKLTAEGGWVFYANKLDNMKSQTAIYGSIANALCPKYTTRNTTNIIYSTSYDKSIGIDSNIRVADYSTQNITTFKNSLNGEILYYELETPTETIISSTLTEEQAKFLTQQNGSIEVINGNGNVAKPDITLEMNIKYWRQ